MANKTRSTPMDPRPAVRPGELSLLEWLSTRDPGAFDQFCDEIFRIFFVICRRFLGSREDAEDAAQDILFKIFRNADLIRPGKDPWAYVLKMTNRHCFDLIRKGHTQKRDERLTDFLDDANKTFQVLSEGNPEMDCEREEVRGQVRNALDQLPEDQRAVLDLRFWAECTYKETADILGIPQGTAVSRERAAFERLKAFTESASPKESKTQPQSAKRERQRISSPGKNNNRQGRRKDLGA